MGTVAKVYAEQLSVLKFGHPLWWPEPTPGLNGETYEVRVADVGYIDEDGAFRRLFNASKGASHELNQGGLPDDFVPLDSEFQQFITTKNRFLDPGSLCSRSVKIGGHISGGLHNGDKTPRLADKAKKITLRVNWPGYSTWSDIIHIYDHAYDANPTTKKKLAYAVAQKIRQCLQDLREERSAEQSRMWWASGFSPEKLILLELQHVSAGSWQPVLAVSS